MCELCVSISPLSACVVSYQLRSMQICVPASAWVLLPIQAFATADFSLAFYPVIRPFPQIPSSLCLAKQIKLFACATKSICVYQIAAPQKQ